MSWWTVAAPPHSDNPNGSFARGLAASILLWALIALAVLSLSSCQSYQPPAGGLEGGVQEVLR